MFDFIRRGEYKALHVQYVLIITVQCYAMLSLYLTNVLHFTVLTHRGYVAREDYPHDTESDQPQGYNIPRNVPRGGDDPVCSGDGDCATFLFDFPMGNNPHTLNNCNGTVKSSGGNTGNSSYSATTNNGSGTNSPLPTAPSSSSASSSPSSSSSSTYPTERNSSTGNSSSSVKRTDRSTSPTPLLSAVTSSSSYKERVERQRIEEQEVDRRRSRLNASFDSCQQDGTPFQLYVPTDSDDESSDDVTTSSHSDNNSSYRNNNSGNNNVRNKNNTNSNYSNNGNNNSSNNSNNNNNTPMENRFKQRREDANSSGSNDADKCNLS